jgi:tetratricopeptide (TPR) repeat protein
VLKYGKLKEFSTFQHDKQTTSNYSVSLKTKRVYCPAKPVHLKAGEKLGKYEGNYYTKDDLGQPDSTLLAISKIVSNEPRLKYAQMVASFTFTALLKKNPNEAIRYGEQALKESNYTGQPPYLGIIGGIKDYEYKLTLPAGVYQLGAEYYSQQIKQCPYPELFDNPKVYNTIANWYWSAGDKAKAMKARRKAKKLEKSIIAKSKTLNLKNEMYKY